MYLLILQAILIWNLYKNICILTILKNIYTIELEILLAELEKSHSRDFWGRTFPCLIVLSEGCPSNSVVNICVVSFVFLDFVL